MEQLLWIASLCVRIGLVARLLLINPKRYRWFIGYLIVASVGTLYLFTLALRSTNYAIAWIVVQISSLILIYAAALEIYGNLAEHFGGVNHKGRIVASLLRILNAIMVLSLVACVALTAFDARVMLDKKLLSVSGAVTATFLLTRIATSTLAVFLAGSALYFSRFRVSLQPNLRIQGVLFALWMTVSATAMFWRNLDKSSNDLISIAYQSASVLIFGAWIAAFRKAGESVPVRLTIAEGSHQADREILISFLKKLTRQR
jgi:hypothetical protein